MENPKVAVGIAAVLLFFVLLPLRHMLTPPPDDPWFQARVIDQKNPVVVKFGANWCGPCRSMEPELRRLRSRYAGKLVVVEIDVDRKPDLASHYGVSSIPRTLLFNQGRLVKSRTGFATQDELKSWVQPYLPN